MNRRKSGRRRRKSAGRKKSNGQKKLSAYKMKRINKAASMMSEDARKKFMKWALSNDPNKGSWGM